MSRILPSVTNDLLILELGSNAVRFLHARIIPGVRFRVLREERVQTRLGGGQSGTLPREAVERTVEAVRDFLNTEWNGQNPRVLAVATSAVREAYDRERLFAPLKHQGVTVRILSGREEARLGAMAALWSQPIQNGVIADLGGASLQLSRVRSGRIVSTASLPLGALRMTRRFVQHDPPTSRELLALREEIRDQVVDALPPARTDDEMVALGGTVRALARMHLVAHGGDGKARQGLRLQQSDVTARRERLQRLSLRERKRVPGLKAERADIILAGAVVVEELMTLGSYLTLTVCTHGVRDGLLLRETFRSVE